MDPADPRHFLVSGDCPADDRNCLGETTDSGQTWNVRPIPGPRCCNNAPKITRGPAFTVYAFATNQLLKSTDWGRTWSSNEFKITGYSVSSLAVGRKYLYASVFPANSSNQKTPVFRSPVEKISWQQVGDVHELMRGEITSIWTHPDLPNIVFIGGSMGLIISRNAGVTWMPFAQKGLPMDKGISDLFILPGSRLRLLGTFSSGVLSFTGNR